MGGFVFCSRTLTNVLLILFFRASGFWMSKYETGKVILGGMGCLFLFQKRYITFFYFYFLGFRDSGWANMESGRWYWGMGMFVFCSRTLTNVLLTFFYLYFFRTSGFWNYLKEHLESGIGKVILGYWEMGTLFLFQER